MSDKTELLPCPFCGTEAELVDHGTGSWRVACLQSKGGCGMAGRMSFDKGITATAEWNRRATIQPTAQLVGEIVMLGCATVVRWHPVMPPAATKLYTGPVAVAPADAVRDAAMPTDISKRLRECANGPMSNQDHAKLMLTAADECERFYGGMVAWKETAQAKDRFNVEAYAHKIAEARNAALEEAATECERVTMFPGGRQECEVHGSVWSAAAAIRAMKTNQKEPT